MSSAIRIPTVRPPEYISELLLCLESLLVALLDLIIPRECIVCRRVLRNNEKYLCIFCASDIPLTRYWNVRKNPMADRLNELVQRDIDKTVLTADDNLSHTSPVKYSYATALFFYREENEYRKIPQRLKYSGDISEGRFFAKILGKHLKHSTLYDDVDMIVPVPLHWTRAWKRGYNQAAIIADALSEVIGVPSFGHFLKRTRRTRTQTKLSIEEKAKNVHNAFCINPEYCPISIASAEESITTSLNAVKPHTIGSTAEKQLTTVPTSPRHILLVDDVFTTGATLHACQKVLQEHFGPAVRISAATLGFVSGGG